MKEREARGQKWAWKGGGGVRIPGLGASGSDCMVWSLVRTALGGKKSATVGVRAWKDGEEGGRE